MEMLGCIMTFTDFLQCALSFSIYIFVITEAISHSWSHFRLGSPVSTSASFNQMTLDAILLPVDCKGTSNDKYKVLANNIWP